MTTHYKFIFIEDCMPVEDISTICLLILGIRPSRFAMGKRLGGLLQLGLLFGKAYLCYVKFISIGYGVAVAEVVVVYDTIVNSAINTVKFL